MREAIISLVLPPSEQEAWDPSDPSSSNTEAIPEKQTVYLHKKVSLCNKWAFVAVIAVSPSGHEYLPWAKSEFM